MSVADEIKDRLDIVEVVNGAVQLKKLGRNYRGLCPFHSEKTPSFVVFPDSQRWHCFGACNQGGDVFDFVMRREGWDFRTALVELGKRAGVEVPRWSEKAQQAYEKRKAREGVLAVAADYFAELLPGSNGERYAKEERGWTDEVIRAECLGYYDGNQPKLREALTEANVDLETPAARAVLKMPPRMLVYVHRRGRRVTYLTTRSVDEKRHWNLDRDLVGPRQPYFNHLWRADAQACLVLEGQPDAITAAQWEMPAVELAKCELDEALLRMLEKHATIYLAFDEDETGRENTERFAARLGPLVRIVRWPEHDANDWLLAGATGKDLQGLLRESPAWIDVLLDEARVEKDDQRVREVFAALARLDAFNLARYRQQVSDDLGMSLSTVDGLLRAARAEIGLDAYGRPMYEVLGGRICKRTYDRSGGESLVALSNFDARIVRDVVEDDGEQTERRFTLEGKLADGAKLPEIEVEAGDFAQMTWVLPGWGARATISAGGSMKDHLRTAIQVLSGQDGREVEARYEYSHLGWRKIGGKMVFLSSAGAVGMDEVQVAVTRDLERYKLPHFPPEDGREAMEASLKFLDVGSFQVTIPLWAAMYLAPLSSVMPPSFTMWLFGTTGSMKSTMAALALCHYGSFAYNTPPASWTGTTNALEKKAFLVKDAPLWIDDYTGQSTSQGMNEIQRKADRLLRDWGNRAGRSRMRADLKLRQTFAPRGLIISTAEMLPPGQSILSRLFAIEVHPEMITRGADSPLTKAQLQESALYSMAMAGYLTWLARWYDDLEQRLNGKLLEYTERARQEGQHLRMPRNVATMYVGWEMGLRYARSVEAIDDDTLEAMLETGWHVLLNIGEQQHQVVAEEKPVEMYLAALEQMFAQGTIYLRHKDRPDMIEEVWPKQRTGTAEMLGWYDEHFWYLLPKAAYSAVWQFYRSSGVVFSDSERGVRVKLLEAKVLLPQGERFTYRLRSGDDLVRVLRVNRVALGNLSQEAGTTGTTGTTGTESEETSKEGQIPF